MPLYPDSATPSLSPTLFAQPNARYRGAPFWSWNGALEQGRLFDQIEEFRRMGLGGFHMHPRTGLTTEYLGTEFMSLVKSCTERAKERGMLAWLYDEDRWPSGFAGGLVTKDHPELAWQFLVLSRAPDAEFKPRTDGLRHIDVWRQGGGRLVARFALTFSAGAMARYRRLADGETAAADEQLWYCYHEINGRANWFNHERYVDCLNPKAIEAFIAVTHERYRAAVGDHFGTTIPAIFTDEPQFVRADPPRTSGDLPGGDQDVILAWTGDFAETYKAAYQADIFATLPEVLWQLPGDAPSLARWRYHDHRSERFAAAFADTLGGWCEKHGIALTGHLMEEQTLHSQIRAVGDSMRSYRGFQLPGIDMLCDAIEFTTAKQAQSAVRQYGRAGMTSELYGVTNWDFDFTGHKRQGDWQAALGVTVRVHHLSWVSMAGEAKRDYPAPIDGHSPWFEQYRVVEDHYARLNTALTRGSALCRVAVIHPIESMWLAWGSLDQTAAARGRLESGFQDLARWLIHGTVDFDYLCESLLPDLSTVSKATPLIVGKMAYDAVILPTLTTIRRSTLDRLLAFQQAGGRVIIAGQAPTLIDAQPGDLSALLKQAVLIPYTATAVLAAIEPQRDVRVVSNQGVQVADLVHQLRRDGDCRWLFICTTSRDRAPGDVRVELAGSWDVELWDTATGTAQLLHSDVDNGWTAFGRHLHAADHVLVKLLPRATAIASLTQAPTNFWWEPRYAITDKAWPITLSEPNVLLLDQASWKLDGGAWQPSCEILRLDNMARAQLGLPPVDGDIAQPWVEPPSTVAGYVTLRFPLVVEHAVHGVLLAFERADVAQITLDGQPVPSIAAGWWVDPALSQVRLPDLAPGIHELTVRLPMALTTTLEWLYLLGDFGVTLGVSGARITKPVRELSFGSWGGQGLPFYAGNVTYHLQAVVDPSVSRVGLQLNQWSGPVVTTAIDGGAASTIAFPPFRADLGAVQPGRRNLDVTVFGNRANAFSQVHLSRPDYSWTGPNAWRTWGREWTDDYQLVPMGLLAPPWLMQLHG